MNTSYTFDLKNNRNRKFLRIGWLLLVLNIVFFWFIFRGLPREEQSVLIPLLIGSFLIIIAIRQFYKKSILFEPRLLSIAMVIAALGWWVLEQTIPAIGHIFLAFLGWQLPARACIVFHQEGITIPAMPTKTFGWEKIQQAIWKEGLLTIDFKNNVLIQEETITNLSTEEAARFNSAAARACSLLPK